MEALGDLKAARQDPIKPDMDLNKLENASSGEV